MSIHDLKASDDSTGSSTTYIEVKSDGSEAQQEAYVLLRRGGKIRGVLSDVDELCARLTPLLADVLFGDDQRGLMECSSLMRTTGRPITTAEIGSSATGQHEPYPFRDCSG